MLQLISQWEGYLNHFPVVLLLKVFPNSQATGWEWKAVVKWHPDLISEGKQKASDKELMMVESEVEWDTETEAQKDGYEYIRNLGFHFNKEIQ